MLCVYLWNKRSAVCQDRNPADGSCSFSYKLTRCLKSLCGNERVHRNKSPAQCSLRVSVSFQPIGQDISCTKNHLTPCGLQRDAIAHRFHTGLVTFPRCGPGGVGLAASLTLLLSSKESNLCYYKAGWSPKAVKTLQQLLPANKRLAITGNTLALRLRQLMWVSPRTGVHWECRRERRE